MGCFHHFSGFLLFGGLLHKVGKPTVIQRSEASLTPLRPLLHENEYKIKHTRVLFIIHPIVREGVKGVSEAKLGSLYRALLQTEYINRFTK